MHWVTCLLWAGKLGVAVTETALASFTTTSGADQCVLGVALAALSCIAVALHASDHPALRAQLGSVLVGAHRPLLQCLAVDAAGLVPKCAMYSWLLCTAPGARGSVSWVQRLFAHAHAAWAIVWAAVHAAAVVHCVAQASWFTLHWLLASAAWSAVNYRVFRAACARLGAAA
jgi:hypothetical protein